MKCFSVCFAAVLLRAAPAPAQVPAVARPDSLTKSRFHEQLAQTPEQFTGGGIEEIPELLTGGGMEGIVAAVQQRLSNAYQLGSGKVWVRFVVQPDGSIFNTKVTKSLSPACDAAALEAVTQLPCFRPGRQNGHPVAVAFVVPVTFGKAPKPSKR